MMHHSTVNFCAVLAAVVDDIVHVSEHVAASVVFIFNTGLSQVTACCRNIHCDSLLPDFGQFAINHRSVPESTHKFSDLSNGRSVVILASNHVYRWELGGDYIFVGRNCGYLPIRSHAFDGISELFVVGVGEGLGWVEQAGQHIKERHSKNSSFI